MLNYMRLEVRRNNLRTYGTASIVICVVMLGLIYLFAFAPQIDGGGDFQILMNYENLITLFGILQMAVFAVLSSVMHSKLITEEYRDKRVVLLFSYPVNRRTVLLAKLAVVSLFTAAAMVISCAVTFGIFLTGEAFMPVVSAVLSPQIILHVLKVTGLMAVTSVSVGIISACIGFINKSVPTTIVSAFLIVAMFSNIVANFLLNFVNYRDLALVLIMCGTLIISAVAASFLTKKIQAMEV